MAIPSTDIQILFTNYDVITYFLNLASCSEHFITGSIKHSIQHHIMFVFEVEIAVIDNISLVMPHK
jgi:hypothetical protein